MIIRVKRTTKSPLLKRETRPFSQEIKTLLALQIEGITQISAWSNKQSDKSVESVERESVKIHAIRVLKKIHEKFVINYMVIRVKEKDSCSLIKL
jgi:hypothetical protein